MTSRAEIERQVAHRAAAFAAESGEVRLRTFFVDRPGIDAG